MSVMTVLLAAIELVAPANEATVALVPDGQRAVLTNETREAREAVYAAKTKEAKKIRRETPWRMAEPVVFRWKVTDGEKGPWEILVGKKPDLSDARHFLFSKANVDAGSGRTKGEVAADEVATTLEHLNLEIATKYYWRVIGNVTCGNFGHGRTCSCKDRKPAVESAIGSFTTEDLAPRWIMIEGKTRNFRDLGGRVGLDGKRVRQGLIYRSQGLNDNSVDGVAKGKNRLTVSDVEYLTETLGIRTDLDIRGVSEVAGLNGVSPLGKGVRYVNRPSLSYHGVFSDSGKRIMAENFREFLDRKNYPILFHCIGGADRTGALAYVLNGVLGVKRQELETDWEMTYYPDLPRSKSSGRPIVDGLTEGLGKYGDEKSSWMDRIVLYLKDCGITDEEIKTFRGIMLTVCQ